MAKATLIGDQKFQLLVHRLGLPGPHVLGLLEYMWQSAYSSCNPILRTRAAIEITAGWTGTVGEFADAVLDPNHNFIDEREDGQFEIHDFWDHAPDFVKKRYLRAAERKGQVVKRVNSNTYSGGQRRTTADNGGFCPPAEANRSQANRSQADPIPPTPLAGRDSALGSDSARLREPKPKTKHTEHAESERDIESTVARLLEFESERNRGPGTTALWLERVRAMARLPDGLHAAHKICDECETRRNPRSAKAKGYSDRPIRDEAAWLNQQTRQWLNERTQKAQ